MQRPPAPRIYLVNVGVNTTHELKSPIYPDDRFEFVPIPEDDEDAAAQDNGGSGTVQPVRYRDLHCYHSPEPLLSLFPRPLANAYASRVVHYDPRLGNGHDGAPADFSYGDVPLVNPRARALKKARPRDWLLFIANLFRYNANHRWFAEQGTFSLIGMIEIGQVLEYVPGKGAVLRDPGSEQLAPLTMYADNAHVNRLLRLPQRYCDQPFSIFQGSARSIRFPYAIPVTPDLCRACFTNKDGQPFEATRFPTFTACVGVYTRTVRAQFSLDKEADRGRFRIFRERIADVVDIPDLLACCRGDA